MADQSKTRKVTASPQVDALASRALNMVAMRNMTSELQLDASFTQRMHDAAAGIDDIDVIDVVDEMMKTGVSAEIIADHYIPHIARQMGEEWCDDTMSFARVTIGTARLQSVLRSLGDAWSSTGQSDLSDPKAAVVVIIVRDSYHTLGAVVLAGQLRRLGISVRLAMGPKYGDIEALFHTYKFDAALISATESDALDSLREIVEVIRQSATDCPPIIVGGAVINGADDVKSRTGADFVTNDPLEALDHCGLMTRIKQNTPHTAERRT